MIAGVLWDLYRAGWVFFALGPQLAVCLLFGYLAARRTVGSMLNWLIAAFLLSLVPLLGAFVMLALWWQATGPAKGPTNPAAAADAAEGSKPADPADAADTADPADTAGKADLAERQA